ncbi:MAG: hypothetical protein IMF19_04550 [Proteobacteria bacterium]|nr:hypothetical protein [Pseudomonadota bacterium]
MEDVKCNFCGLTIDEVDHMVAGPDVHICNGCIELCTEIWEEFKKEKSGVYLEEEEEG